MKSCILLDVGSTRRMDDKLKNLINISHPPELIKHLDEIHQLIYFNKVFKIIINKTILRSKLSLQILI